MAYKNAKMGAVLAAAALGLGACGGGGEEQPAETTAQNEQQTTNAAAKPQIKVMSPTEGAKVGSQFMAKADIGNFKIDPEAVGKAPKQGSGHLHFSLDGGKFDHPKYSGANGKLAVQLGTDGKYSPAVAPQVMYKNIPAGQHTLKVMAANNDHSETGGEAQVKFTVAGNETAGKKGKNGDMVAFSNVQMTDGGFTAQAKLTNFEIDAKAVGMKPEPNKGHLHFSLDGGKFDRPKYSGANGELAVKLGTDGKYSPAVAPMITYKNLPKGKHTLKVMAANHDHSETGAVSTKKLTVK